MAKDLRQVCIAASGVTSSLAITNAVIGIPYCIWSIRVKNTFIESAAA
jgi:hypothetical protein